MKKFLAEWRLRNARTSAVELGMRDAHGAEHAFTADNTGAASLSVELNDRIPIHIVPAN